MTLAQAATKVCRRCGEELPATQEFWLPLAGKPGQWHSGCRKCRNVAKLAHYHKTKIRALPPTLTCAHCGNDFSPAKMACGKTKFCSTQCRDRNRAPRRAAQKREHGIEYRKRPEIREKQRLNTAKWRRENQQHIMDNRLSYYARWKYGITQEEFDALLEQQGGRCAICRTTDTSPHKRFSIDHCHERGHVRGLLCHYCNVALGALKDRPELLRVAADYLERTA